MTDPSGLASNLRSSEHNVRVEDADSMLGQLTSEVHEALCALFHEALMSVGCSRQAMMTVGEASSLKFELASALAPSGGARIRQPLDELVQQQPGPTTLSADTHDQTDVASEPTQIWNKLAAKLPQDMRARALELADGGVRSREFKRPCVPSAWAALPSLLRAIGITWR